MRHTFFDSLVILSLGGVFLAGTAGAQSQPAQRQDTAPASATSKSKDAQNSPPPKKVYTDEDLKSMRENGVSVTGDSKAQKKPATSNSAKNQQREEAYWHSRAQNLRNRMAEVDRQMAQINAATPQNSATAGSGNVTGSTTTGSVPIQFGGQYGRLKSLQAQKASLEKQLENLEDEARKAGVPPGGLR